MAVKEISTRFKLEGEQQYKSAMSDAARAISVLNSEQKLAKAQFEATGDAEQYAADQSRILKEQIAQQQKAVEAAEKAIKELTNNGVDKNSTQVQKWQTKLNNARTSLTQMQTRLDKVDGDLQENKDEFGKAETGAKNYDEQIQKVGKAIDIKAALDSLGSITGAIEKVVTKAAQAAKAMWELGADAGTWADNLITQATELGVDVETLQSWQYAARFVDSSVEDIVKNWRDLSDEKLLNDGKLTEKGKAITDLKVAIYDASGTLKSSQAIFWDTIDALHGLEGVELEQMATRIFGNDWRKMLPLIKAGSAGWNEYAEQGREVSVVSEENVQALGAVDDAMQDLQARADKLKMDALAALAPTFQTVAEALSTAVTALNDFIQSEEGQAALASLNEALSGIISSLLGEDNGKGTFESIVEKAAGAIKSLDGGLQWIANNKDAVTKTITGLAIAFGAMKISQGVLTALQLLNALPLSKLTTLFGGGAGAGAAKVAEATATTAAGAGIGAKVAGGVAALKAAGAAVAPVAIPVAVVGGLMAGVAYAGDKAYRDRMAPFNAVHASVMERDASQESADEAWLRKWVEAVDEAGHGNGNAKLTELLENNWEQLKQNYNIRYDWDQLWLPGLTGGTKQEIGEDIVVAIAKQIEEKKAAMEEAGKGAAEGFTEAISDGASSASDAGAEMAEGAIEGASSMLDEHSPSRVFRDIGENVAIGFADGIYARGNEAIEAAIWMAANVERVVRDALDINSPSGVFEQMGAYTGEGFALGIEGSAARVTRAMDTMLAATNRPVAVRAGRYDSAAGVAGEPGMVHVSLVLNEREVAETFAPIVNDKIGADLNAVRR